jgi:hypothetical protein
MLKGSEQCRKQGREETSGDDMRLLGNIVCIECLSCGCHSNFHGKLCTHPCRRVQDGDEQGMNGQRPFDEGEGTGGGGGGPRWEGGAWHGLGRCLTGTGLLSGVGDATGRQPGCRGAAGTVCHVGLVQR